MRPVGIIAVPALLAGLLCSGAIGAQPAPPKQTLTLAQAERRAIELKHGMTLQEVQDLLGKPRRTALKALSPGSTPELSQGALHWTYAWSPGASQSEGTLQVVFASSKAPERWLVQSWDWAGY
jgi:hypothetical protein